MNFAQDFRLVIYGMSIPDINEDVIAYELGIVGDGDILPEEAVNFNLVRNMQQFMHALGIHEGEMLIRNGLGEDGWDPLGGDWMVTTIVNIPTGGYAMRLQSIQQYELDMDYGEPLEMRPLSMTLVQSGINIRTDMRNLLAYVQHHWGNEMGINDIGGGGDMYMVD